MKVPLSLLLCFPVLSLSIALPPQTSPESVKTLFARGNNDCPATEVPEYQDLDVAMRLSALNEMVLIDKDQDPACEGLLEKRSWLLPALLRGPIYNRLAAFRGRLTTGFDLLVAQYHYDTRRGPRDVERPGYPAGNDLARRRANKPNQFIFGIDTTTDLIKRPLQRTPLLPSMVPHLKTQFTGPKELSAEHLVEVAPTLAFEKRVMNDPRFDVKWLIIEHIKYSLGSRKEYLTPISHLRRAVGSGTFPDELLIMTKELNSAKAPLAQGKEAISDYIWNKFGDNAGAKFEAIARIPAVAEAMLDPDVRKATTVQMQRLTLTTASWDTLYAEWHCIFLKDPTVWDRAKTLILKDLQAAKAAQASKQAAHKKDHAAKKALDPNYPEDTKTWPDIIVTLPDKPPSPSPSTDTFESEWICLQNEIYGKLRGHAESELCRLQGKMDAEYKLGGKYNCDATEAKKDKDCKEEFRKAVMALQLPQGWANGQKPIIEQSDFKFQGPVVIQIDPSWTP